MTKMTSAPKGQIVKHALITILVFCSTNNIALSEEVDTQLLSAYEGNPQSQLQLGLRYAKKSKSDQSNQLANNQKALYWYTQAARQGMAKAQYNLGHFYYKGLGVEKDREQTIQWWSKAAHQGYGPAQHNMGLAYFEGIGISKNQTRAKQWFELCASQGEKQCQQALERIKPDHTAIVETVTATPDQSVQETHVIFLKKNTNSLVIGETKSQNSLKQLEVVSTQDQWQQVKLNTNFAVWVYKSFTTTSNGIATLTGDNVRARTSPTTKANNIVTELSLKTELSVLQTKEKWIQLALPNMVGWVNLKPAQTQAEQGNNTQNGQILVLNKNTYQDSYSFNDTQSDDEWLFSRSDQLYTVQLKNFDSQKSINNYLSEKDLADNDDCHILLSKRHNIEWKYILFGSFETKEAAELAASENQFNDFRIEQLGNIQQQRCSAWKTTLPPPKNLDNYCVVKS